MERAVTSVIMHVLIFGFLGILLIVVGVFMYQLKRTAESQAAKLNQVLQELAALRERFQPPAA